MCRTAQSFTIFALFLFAPRAVAYFEYSVRYNINSCTACHFQPSGGGPRTIDGKLFGAHGYQMNPALVQDYVSADFRALYYLPERPGTSRNGMGLMSGSVAGHARLDDSGKIQLVIEHNVAGFAAATFRDTYALFKLTPHRQGPAWLDTLLVGRFRVPFGIVTDEHRTYTRIQTATEWYTFETGFMLSGSPYSELHYDLALVNGENATGQSLGSAQASRWGSVANVRWMPGAILLGASASYHDRRAPEESPRAASLYAALSIGRWTDDQVPVTIELEHVRAWGLNGNLEGVLASDANYVKALERAQSQGWLLYANWAVSRRFSIIYKYDLLTPDRDYPVDFYDRHGLGFRWAIGPNTLLQMRVELARATPSSEVMGESIGSRGAGYGLLQLGF